MTTGDRAKLELDELPDVGADRSTSTRPPIPLVPIALGIILGIHFDRALMPPIWGIVVLGLIGLLFALPIASKVRLVSILPRTRRYLVASFLMAVAVGMARHAGNQRYIPADHIAQFARGQPLIVSVTGRLASPVRIIEPNAEIPRAYDMSPRTRFLLDVESAEGTSGPVPVTGRLMISINEPILDVSEGARVTITGWLYRIRPPSNPGAYDWAAHHRRDGILAALSTDHAAAMRVIERPATRGLGSFVDEMRRRLNRYLVEVSFPDDEESAGVVAAMVLGQRSVVSRSLNESFMRTGNVHFLAASGMNVAWLALVGWVFARVINIQYRAATVGIAILIVTFVLISEPQPSILRAGIVGLVACITIYFRGRRNSINSLAFAAILLLLFRPGDWFSAGFQLTFIATLGLLHVFPVLSNALAHAFIRLGRPRLASLLVIGDTEPFDPYFALLPETRLPGWALRACSVVLQTLVLAIAEWIVTWPLTCFHFNTFTPWGAIGTFLVAPLAMITAWVGFITLLIGLPYPSLGALIGPVLNVVCRLMVELVAWLAKLPGTLLDGRSPSGTWVVVVYGVMALWVYSSEKFRGRFRRPLVAASILVCAWWVANPLLIGRANGALRVWCLAVGDGTGTVIELPNGKTVLYDFGTRSNLDAAMVAHDFLRHRGIGEINTAFVSHANFDHYGAIETIARRVPIRRILINDQFEPSIRENPAAQRFLKSMRDNGVIVETFSGETQFDLCPDVEITSIWPPPHADKPAPSDNDASTVLRLEYEGKSILLTGDIAEWALGGSVDTVADRLRADVLALPHHGSVVTNTRGFIEAANPSAAIRSSGQRRALTVNGIEELVGNNRQYFNTADDGCVVVTLQNGAAIVERAMEAE